MTLKSWYVLLFGCLVAVFSMFSLACAGAKPSDGSGAAQVPQASGSPGHCHATGSGDLTLPDRHCTPGVADPNVQSDGRTLVGRSKGKTYDLCKGRGDGGWSGAIRPSSDYTNKLERQQIIEYNLRDGKGNLLSQDQTEEDHLIPLEVGGSPTDPKNLWPQYPHSPNKKDSIENKAHKLACTHPEQLSQIQQAIATDWISYGKQIGAL